MLWRPFFHALNMRKVLYNIVTRIARITQARRNSPWSKVLVLPCRIDVDDDAGEKV